MQEVRHVGIQYLEAVTSLLQRIGQFDHTAGLLEAADLHWWWRAPRSTDSFPQLFWFDDLGRPEAAVIATDWGDGVALDPIIMPNADPDWVAHVVDRGLSHAKESGLQNVEVVVDRADRVVQEVLRRHGFTTKTDQKQDVVLACLAIVDRPLVSALRDGYRLCNRLSTSHWPHHMIARNGPELEERLRQSWLYRPELDLLVLDKSENVAAYGLLWFDPTTATGLVEPMRTENDHQQRGLARHLLTAGIDMLAATGAQRVKLCYKPANTVAKDLYLGVGFKPYRQTSVFSRGCPSSEA